MEHENNLIEVIAGKATGQFDVNGGDWTATVDDSMELPPSQRALYSAIKIAAMAYRTELNTENLTPDAMPRVDESTQIRQTAGGNIDIRRRIHLINFPKCFKMDETFEAFVMELTGTPKEKQRLADQMVADDPSDGQIHLDLAKHVAKMMRKEQKLKKLVDDTTVIFHSDASSDGIESSDPKVVVVAKGPLPGLVQKKQETPDIRSATGTLSLDGIMNRSRVYHFSGKVEGFSETTYACVFESPLLRANVHPMLCDSLKGVGGARYQVKVKRREVPKSGAKFDILECEPIKERQIQMDTVGQLAPV